MRVFWNTEIINPKRESLCCAMHAMEIEISTSFTSAVSKISCIDKCLRRKKKPALISWTVSNPAPLRQS
jgi:hypothetical protein